MTWQVPTGISVTVWAVLLLLALPLLSVAISLKLATGSLFGVAGRPLVVCLYVVIVAAAAWLLTGMLGSRVVVEGEQITLKCSIYSRSISRSDIEPASVVVVASGAAPGLTLRTNGVGLPGYQAGWFRDRDGRKVFVVYGKGPWVTFRTRDGISHVVGAGDTEAASRVLKGSS